MDEGRPKAIALIVEDDHDLLQLTAMLLQESGFDTVECESAEAALAVMLLTRVLQPALIYLCHRGLRRSDELNPPTGPSSPNDPLPIRSPGPANPSFT